MFSVFNTEKSIRENLGQQWFYTRNARANLTFDKSIVERYDQAESILEHNCPTSFSIHPDVVLG